MTSIAATGEGRILRWGRLLLLGMIGAIVAFAWTGWGAAPPSREAFYNRDLWMRDGGWDDADRDCQDTRAEVLVRDARPDTVRFRGQGHCVVASGVWEDPYTGAVVTDPARLDVDHLVPLRWAHGRGGGIWPPDQKQAFANDLGYRWHLVAASRGANRQKGARGPDRWRPPRREFRCQYAEAWAAVTTVWGLRVTGAEREALRAMLAECR